MLLFTIAKMLFVGSLPEKKQEMDKQQLLDLVKHLEQGAEISADSIPDGQRTWKRYWVPSQAVFTELMHGLKDFDFVADGNGVLIYASPAQRRLVVYTEGDVDAIQYASPEDFRRGLARHAAFYAAYDRAVFRQLARYCQELFAERSMSSLEME